tara:strand:- start:398 stop:1048 length:651 start_codon:yes stop_codon:yes gene_type:complete
MTKKIVRGFLKKHYYCEKCNSPVEKTTIVCQTCGSEFEEFVKAEEGRIRRALKKIKRAIAKPKSPAQIVEEMEPIEEDPREEVEEAPEEEYEEPPDQEPVKENYENEVEEEIYDEDEEPESEEVKAPELAPAFVEPETPLEEEVDKHEAIIAKSEPLEQVQLKKTALFTPKFKTVLWAIVVGMVLWGLFASDEIIIIGAALVLVVIQLEAIKKKLG